MSIIFFYFILFYMLRFGQGFRNPMTEICISKKIFRQNIFTPKKTPSNQLICTHLIKLKCVIANSRQV